ncbi:MAG: hypothetical protein KA533_03495 [Sphingobium sp.]|nr:hypothetical protein [Sphingobium sp.]MBP6111547.1 hypothetical protein [Sphingobium sp.]MBP8670524.1 hypothetical protein [Sphingobium sp.]MBP9157279.1 hypothetical protein [Sphingobium sp.]MCC6483100.1 hypothetical protein [Sphingomonadaceae bacterium]
MSRPTLPPVGERGVALLEVLIACAIIMAMLGVTYQAMQTHARAAHRLDDQREAVLVAQSVLARVGADIALAPGVTDGGERGLHWRIEIDRYRGDGAGPNDDPVLMQVKVIVGAKVDSTGGFTLATLRLAS